MSLPRHSQRAAIRRLFNTLCKRYSSSSFLTNPVEPVLIPSDKHTIPDSIKRPEYVTSTPPKNRLFESFIKVKKTQTVNEDTVSRVRQACRLGRRILNHLELITEAGVTTNEIDYVARHLIIRHGAYPSPLGYRGFPKSICTSVNNVVVHGIPDSRPLEDGDIINIDVTVFMNGVHGDVSSTFCVGNVDLQSRKLMQITRECLDEAIRVCRPDAEFSMIGSIISDHAEENGFKVCPYFVGHGIGEEFHGEPQILHHRNSFGGRMKKGLIFTIEPVLCAGSSEVKHWNDNWTVATHDNCRSAQFEETVYIHPNGVEVLTENSPDDCYLHPTDETLNDMSGLRQGFAEWNKMVV